MKVGGNVVAIITGANGQLGKELQQFLMNKNETFEALDKSELDITDGKAVMQLFSDIKPDVVYHCAAYTAVDAAEDSSELNWQINVEGTRNVAKAAEKIGASLVYVSTDYVFDGEKSIPYIENDQTNPLNEYGKAKLAGEKVVTEIMSKYYIVRTSWVFGEYGKNFVYTMIRLSENHDELKVVSDQVGRPTWTKTLAEFMHHLVETKPTYGTYHLSNDGTCSWHQFASEILKDKSIKIHPVTSEEYPQKAKRSKYSVMDLDKAKATGFDILSWQEALELFLKSIEP